MRGEETQIFGAIETRSPALVIAPGTHSKWARIEAGRVSDTRTYMTGELFALLKSHSILGRLIQGDAPNEEAFLRGAERGLADAALLNLLFSVRTEGLFERIAPDALSAYLSGLLIGSEAAEGLSLLKLERNAPILVVGAGDIAGLYKRVLAFSGAENVSVVDGEQAAARGLWRLAQIKAAA
jgi:2-dehydro-3-deoxygalactonokinase